MKLYVACAVCSLRRAHNAGHGRAEHMCSRGEPLGMRGLLWDAQGDVMAARVVGIRQEGESLPDGAIRGGTRYASSCHDVTGKVQGARAASFRAGAAQNLKKNGEQQQTSLSGEQDSLGRGERPPVLGTGHD